MSARLPTRMIGSSTQNRSTLILTESMPPGQMGSSALASRNRNSTHRSNTHLQTPSSDVCAVMSYITRSLLLSFFAMWWEQGYGLPENDSDHSCHQHYGSRQSPIVAYSIFCIIGEG